MKHEIPSSNLQRNFKHQIPTLSLLRKRLDVGAWSFSGAWMMVLGIFVWLPVVSSTSAEASSGERFAVEQKADRLVITHAGQPLTDFVFTDTNILRPYFCSVHTLDGIQVTRNHPPIPDVDPADHATMHPGIWLAFGDISGQDFWRNKATIQHDRFTEAPAVRDGKLTFATENTMITTNGESLATLNLQFTIQDVRDGYLVEWRAAFTPLTDNFTFGDQEEMGFGVRVATPITEKNGGTVQNSEGIKGAKAAWGKIADWCDYCGVISNRLVGMTVMSDPQNFRPSWFHSRDYGLLEANPFGRNAFTKGEASSVPVAKGQTFQLRFAAFIHSTPTNEPPDIAAAYRTLTSKQ
jgi:Family of unknown function (DUF6807)